MGYKPPPPPNMGKKVVIPTGPVKGPLSPSPEGWPYVCRSGISFMIERTEPYEAVKAARGSVFLFCRKHHEDDYEFLDDDGEPKYLGERVAVLYGPIDKDED